jgi:hypothetical protein
MGYVPTHLPGSARLVILHGSISGPGKLRKHFDASWRPGISADWKLHISEDLITKNCSSRTAANRVAQTTTNLPPGAQGRRPPPFSGQSHLTEQQEVAYPLVSAPICSILGVDFGAASASVACCRAGPPIGGPDRIGLKHFPGFFRGIDPYLSC